MTVTGPLMYRAEWSFKKQLSYRLLCPFNFHLDVTESKWVVYYAKSLSTIFYCFN